MSPPGGEHTPELLLAPSPRALEGPLSGVSDQRPLHLLTTHLSLDVDRTGLSTTLTGETEWRRAFENSSVVNRDAPCVHISTEIPGPYCHDWGGLRVYGVGDERGGEPSVSCLTLRGDGSVGVESIPWDRFGLRAVDGVGSSTAGTLTEMGVSRRTDLLDLGVAEVADFDGFGRKRAEQLLEAAEAFEDGDVVLDGTGLSDLPEGDPIYIDIETDGLSPRMIWLLGVYDSRGEEYVDFVETDPQNRSGALVAFAEWLADRDRSRPVVAYHGWGFDFPEIESHLRQFADSYLDVWTNRYRWDPKQWANDHATLPGRTNRQKHVAAALGYESDETGLSGATVGRKFARWMRDPTPENDLAWDVHRRYCRDDVMALVFITNAILDAAEDLGGKGSTPTGDGTSQSTLGNY